MNAANEPESNRHLGELAELHALGTLEPFEAAQVVAHAASCADCARALGAAEATVAGLDGAFVPQIEPPARLAARIAASAALVETPAKHRRVAGKQRPVAGYATAAALLLAAGIGGGAAFERSADARQAARDSAVLATLATSHFNHVTLTARAAGAPVSKVIYARDGGWFYIVIDSAACACRIVARSASGERDFGPPAARGTTATLFVRSAARPTSVALTSGSGRVILDAKLVYTAR